MIEVWILYLVRHFRDKLLDLVFGKVDMEPSYKSTTAPPTPPPL